MLGGGGAGGVLVGVEVRLAHPRLEVLQRGFALDALALDHPDLLLELPGAVSGLTKSEVDEALVGHLRPQDLRIVVVTGDAEAFIAALTGSEATPPVYEGIDPDASTAARDADIAARALGLDEVLVVPAEGIFR